MSNSTAVMQFEIDRERLSRYGDPVTAYSARQVLHRLIRAAMVDTYDNGGTFVLVVTADKITVVQRADGEHP